MSALRVVIIGSEGRMGRALREAIESSPDLVYRAGLDREASAAADNRGIAVYARAADMPDDYDVAIDFAGAPATAAMLELARRDRRPLVSASTGRSAEQEAALQALAAEQPLLCDANLSYGVQVMLELARLAARRLGDGFDIELLEAHHRDKRDAPSGTALRLAAAVQEEMARSHGRELGLCHDRSARHESRPRDEIGMQVIRAGTIVGRHELLFGGPDETIRISHEARDRSVFAYGALRAARFLVTQPPGLYSMTDLVRATLADTK